MRRHYSTWDVLAIVYWPPSQKADLELATERMRLTGPARRAEARRKYALRTQRRWITVLRGFASLTLLLAVVSLASQGTNTKAWRLVSTICMSVAAWAIWYMLNSTARDNRARYFAARRMREHDLVRKAPREIAAIQPLGLRNSELIIRREQALPLLRTLPSLPRHCALAVDHVFLRSAIFALLPVYAASPLLTTWDLPGRNLAVNILIGVVSVLLSTMAISLARLKSRSRRALKQNLCPDCGYLLTDVPSTPSSLQPTLNLGPKRCPECGSPWPLIPLTLNSRPPSPTSLPQTPSNPSPPPP